MRRMPVVLVTVLLLALAASGAAAQVADVPPDHWAYRAVQILVERGYIELASDGTFRGNEPADRYQLAAVVGRLLEDIEAGRGWVPG
ncbi:MAG: S-layer homology domain-containing protein, partial [Limnochordales bacterium]